MKILFHPLACCFFLFTASFQAAIAQIPAVSGLPVEWQHLFIIPGNNSSSATSMYPEDLLFNEAGNPCFLHNTGLLEGSLFTELDVAGGAVVAQQNNDLAGLGFRLVGVSLVKEPNGVIRILGNRIISNSVQAIPPVGTFAWQKIANGQSSEILAPTWQEGGTLCRNDRGLPWILPVGDDHYWLATTYVGTDNQTVAWIRSAEGNNGLLTDTICVLNRPLRNGVPVGNFSDFSRIRGFEKLQNGQFLLLYAQERSAAEPDFSVNELIWLDQTGSVLNRLDITEASHFATLPKLLVHEDKILVYGTATPPSPTQPGKTGLVVLSQEGSILWSTGTSPAPAFYFSELCFEGDDQLLLIGTRPETPNRLDISKWTIGAANSQPMDSLVFEDNNFRATCTGALLSADHHLLMQVQLDRFNGFPDPTVTPLNIFHTAFMVNPANFTGASNSSEAFSGTPFSIFPNPTVGRIQLKGLPAEAVKITIGDYTGRIFYQSPFALHTGEVQHQLPEGKYWLQIITATGQQTTQPFWVKNNP